LLSSHRTRRRVLPGWRRRRDARALGRRQLDPIGDLFAPAGYKREVALTLIEQGARAGGRVIEIALTVNGVRYERRVEPRLLLSDFIRHELKLYGTHVGCEQRVCGACTVLLDGRPARSCLTLAVQADGASIETVESLPDGGALHPLQQAFHAHFGLQCGFCTPGILMTAAFFLAQNPDPTEEEVRAELAAHLCRCTGYVSIVDSILAAAGKLPA
jgi:aerobic-type carbon monoxide dehydrogenase small subunit (CoxS/CutS family)